MTPPSYQDIVAHAIALCPGVDENEIRAGSMPMESLDLIIGHLGNTAHTVGIHVGSFVGVSLCYLLANTYCRIVSIDANIPHRGIQRPADVAAELLCGFEPAKGYSSRCLNAIGYSLHPSPINDGLASYEDLKSSTETPKPVRLREQLGLLLDLAGPRFDWVLLDGYHDEVYALQEGDLASRLLKRRGLLILDDVHPNWPGVQEAFEQLHTEDESCFEEVARDGRVGILRKI